MYYFDVIKKEISDVVQAYETEGKVDPRVQKNMEEIKIIGQIISIVEDDAAYLESQMKKAERGGFISPRVNSNRSLNK